MATIQKLVLVTVSTISWVCVCVFDFCIHLVFQNRILKILRTDLSEFWSQKYLIIAYFFIEIEIFQSFPEFEAIQFNLKNVKKCFSMVETGFEPARACAQGNLSPPP